MCFQWLQLFERKLYETLYEKNTYNGILKISLNEIFVKHLEMPGP